MYVVPSTKYSPSFNFPVKIPRDKAMIPVGSEVTIIDFPIREINGQKGVVKMYDEKTGRYKVEMHSTKNGQKGPQEFLLGKEKLKIEALTLPQNSPEQEKSLRDN